MAGRRGKRGRRETSNAEHVPRMAGEWRHSDKLTEGKGWDRDRDGEASGDWQTKRNSEVYRGANRGNVRWRETGRLFHGFSQDVWGQRPPCSVPVDWLLPTVPTVSFGDWLLLDFHRQRLFTWLSMLCRPFHSQTRSTARGEPISRSSDDAVT